MSRYFAPESTTEAVELLRTTPGARIVAGGTDLVVAGRGGKQPIPEVLVAIHRLTELNRVRETEAGITLGTLTTHAWIERSPLVRSRYSALADASAMIGSPATRATGTLGGNLMNASPAMDAGSPLLVLDATVELRRTGVIRALTVAELLAGPGRTTAAPEELLSSVRIPAPVPGTGSAYVRLEHRRAMEIAIVGAAAALRFDPQGRVVAARLALTAAAPVCLRVPAAEAGLLGRRLDADALAAAGRAAVAAVRPISDVRAGADYRRAMTAVVTARALTRAARRAAGADICAAGGDGPPTAIGSVQ
ncbi:FAD binding domain-containing protein [Pseudonocardia sp. H11422]|uniref:FAD binding domain-containing protein n=1 Tax=Pseudonocardia sp. H11422 TaxID=2835866 RepID=UPI001BDD7454|nr:FAD binding domain-containing protein [Pseudonocardia sp. H11422]